MVRSLTALSLSVLIGAGLAACDGPSPPAAGRPSPLPSSAPPTITPSTPRAQPQRSWKMPNLVGSNLQEAQDAVQKLTDFEIPVTTSHDATGAGRLQVLDRNWKVCSQSVPVGRTIDADTRIDFGTVKLDERCPIALRPLAQSSPLF